MRQQREPDVETDIEDLMAASGRHRLVPREGLVGAHTERRAGLSGGVEEPVGAGAEVAPTKKAQLYELARHELTPERGAVSRAELDRVAWDTLQWLERRLTAEVTPWRDRAVNWLRADWRRSAGIAAGTVLGVGLLVYAARRA